MNTRKIAVPFTEPDGPMKTLTIKITPDAHRIAKMAGLLFRVRIEQVIDTALRLYARQFQLDKEMSSMMLEAMHPGSTPARLPGDYQKP